MKNYYEILEVDSKASPEVIEKAYKTLVKKYHPDLQNGIRKNEYEEKMKQINEAYAVLTDDYKKTTYDEQLKSTIISREEYEKAIHENERLRNELERNATSNGNTNQFNNIRNNYQGNVQNSEYDGFRDGNTITNMGKIIQDEIKKVKEQAYKNAYGDAYIQDMKNRGYNIKYKRDFKYYIKLIGYILGAILICILIYQIPLVKSFFTDLYEENIFFKIIVNIFKAIINGFISVFKTKPW